MIEKSTLPPPPSLADVLSAQRVLRRYLNPTPLYNYPVLDAATGAEVWVKHENYQPIGAFKLRGGINFMAGLSAEQRRKGVVTASTGNHGQSVAYAARMFGAKAVISVPENANPVKLEAMRANGADVRLNGADFEQAKKHGEQIADEEGMQFVSSGDEPALIAGVATHTLEVLQEKPDIDAIIVPVGGGERRVGRFSSRQGAQPRHSHGGRLRRGFTSRLPGVARQGVARSAESDRSGGACDGGALHAAAIDPLGPAG